MHFRFKFTAARAASVAAICLVSIASSVSFAFPLAGKCMKVTQYTEVVSWATLEEMYSESKLEVAVSISKDESLVAFKVPAYEGNENMYYYLRTGDKFIGIYDDSQAAAETGSKIDVKVTGNRSFEFSKSNSPNSQKPHLRKWNNYRVRILMSGEGPDGLRLEKEVCNTYR